MLNHLVTPAAIHNVLEGVIGDVIGKGGVKVTVDIDFPSLNYSFRLRVERYNRIFYVRTGVPMQDFEDAQRSGMLADVLGTVAESLARSATEGFTKHLESLGLR